MTSSTQTIRDPALAGTPRLSIGTKIAAGYGLALIAFLTIGGVSYHNIRALDDDAEWVLHTMQVEQRLEAISLAMVRATSNARAFEITGNPDSAEKVAAFKPEILDGIQQLRELTADNPRQLDRLRQLDPNVERRFELLGQLIAARRAYKKEGAPGVVDLVIQGQNEADQFRQIIDAMEGEEKGLLDARQAMMRSARAATVATIVWGTLAAFFLVLAAGAGIVRGLLASLRRLYDAAQHIGAGSYDHRIETFSRDEVGQLATVFNRMAEQVEQRQEALAEQEWLKGSLARFTSLFQGQRDTAKVGAALVAEIAEVLPVRQGAVYLAETESERPALRFLAGFAAGHPPERIAPGEGLIGQCFTAKQTLFIDDAPPEYLRVRSALGEAAPRSLAVLPALFEGEVRGVVELAFFREPTAIQRAFLSQLFAHVGLALNAIEGRRQLEESESELQQQREELIQSNEEIQQTNAELEQANVELEERAERLDEQRVHMEEKNREIEQARETLREQAEQLAQSSKYKSEFLANMSHELRTPLNSLLILSEILAENGGRNLTNKQVEYARTIHSSGADLLELINDILDLAKIESGTVEAEIDELPLANLSQFIEATFRPVAESRGLEFEIELDPRLPQSIQTDMRRLQQVIKNLLSNAFKFTPHGSVRLRITSAPGVDGHLDFAVVDTGVGIPAEKQQVIFEAFRQAEAGTARKYGGTGLGLSISREIARLLGGSLGVTSEAGRGSTFTLRLPLAFGESAVPVFPAAAPQEAREIEPERGLPADDRASIQPGDRVLLIVEDDDHFSRVLADFGREKGFKAVVTRQADNVLRLAEKFQPAAITLDLRLPHQEGWGVLDRLKHAPATRHIPVHVISVREERERSLKLGAVSFLQKPVSREALERLLTRTREFIDRPVKNLLIVEDDPRQRRSLIELIGNGDVATTAVGTGAEALELLEAGRFDCLVLDLGLPDVNGFELIRRIKDRPYGAVLPIIVYTGRSLTRAEEIELQKVSEAIIVKDVKSPERLLDETALFLHRVQDRLPEEKRRIIERARQSDSVLAGRTVLVIDDDLRNIFAITAALEQHHMNVIYADNGREGLELLERTPEIEAVLIDVMMPEIDGLEAMRRLRADPKHRRLPVLAITAKAMKGDREKCLDAGASDYITKPLDMDQLRSLLRVWLYR